MSRAEESPRSAEQKQVDVDAHYQRVGEVYDVLGRLGGALAPGNADKTRWYHNEQNATGTWDGRARPTLHARESDRAVLRVDRTLYMAVNYAPTDYYMDSWARYRWTESSDGREWEDDEEKPLPDYSDLVAYAPFADVDLVDEVKYDRPEGSVPNDLVAEALDEYIAGFAELCDGRGPVHALDSVGGAYVFVAPSVSTPIAERYVGEERHLVMNELTDRVNDFLDDVVERAVERVPDHDSALDTDVINHKNRVYKAPLALHSDLDGVVTPVDAEEPAYEYTPVGEVTEQHVDESLAWARSFTADYRERAGHLVAALWGGEPAQWRDTLDEWVAEEQATEPTPEPATPPSGASTDSESDGAESAGDIAETFRALDDLDFERVAEKTIVSGWNPDAKGGRGPGFYPIWDPDCNGTANIIDLRKGIWLDTGSGDHGTPVEWALIAEGNWTRGEIARGKDWFRGLRALNDLGCDIPIPQGDTPDDMSPYYSHDLSSVAEDHGLIADPYEDDETLLKACLHAREDAPALEDEKPPYGALTAVAETAGLPMDDADEGVLGKSTYKVARRVFDDLEPGDV